MCCRVSALIQTVTPVTPTAPTIGVRSRSLSDSEWEQIFWNVVEKFQNLVQRESYGEKKLTKKIITKFSIFMEHPLVSRQPLSYESFRKFPCPTLAPVLPHQLRFRPLLCSMELHHTQYCYFLIQESLKWGSQFLFNNWKRNSLQRNIVSRMCYLNFYAAINIVSFLSILFLLVWGWRMVNPGERMESYWQKVTENSSRI